MKMLIAGEWVDRTDKIEVRNPYDDSLIDTVPKAAAEDLDAAIESAQRGFAAMRTLPAHERADVLLRVSERLKADAEDLARLLAMEVGKTVREGRTEVARASTTFRWASEEAKRIHGETVPFDAAPGAENKVGFYVREPVGLVCAITPFNFPLNLAAHKLAPAFAAGCSVVLKPASVTPLADIRLGEILLNILTGPGDVIGDSLVADERIRKVSFTGSAEVGKRIMKTAGLKKCTMELGSDSAVVLMDDCDLSAACERIKVGGYAVAGQVCISTQRVLVHERIYDEFLQTMLPLVEGLKAGDQLVESTDVGPMVTEQAAALTEQRIAEAVARGARVLCG
ncbi:MAG: aldehyde dehydrogenase family protein, partial [Armatimonadota bacterium]